MSGEQEAGSELDIRHHAGAGDSAVHVDTEQQVMAAMSATAWLRTEQLAKRDGLGDAEIFALAIGCPQHGNAGMDWDDAGVFCSPCDRIATAAAKEEQVTDETETCHCGSPMRGSDHCPWCGCEEMESTCGLQWDGKS